MTATSADIAMASREFNRAANRLPTLFSLSAEFDRLLSLYEDPDSDPDEINAELEKVAGDIRAKSHGVAVVLQGLDRLAEFQRAESRRLAEKARVNEAHAERLRQYALTCMTSMGIDRLETGIFTLAVRQNPPAVVVLDAAAVPGEFTKTVITVNVDKRGILDHHKATGEIPAGVDIQRGQRLEIR